MKEYIDQWIYEKTFFLHEHFPSWFDSIDEVTEYYVFYKDGSCSNRLIGIEREEFEEMTADYELYHYRKKIREKKDK